MQVKSHKRMIILLALFTILTLVSIIVVYASHQIPTQETITTTLCAYTSTATYDYTAILEPNTIYSDKRTLEPNEGTLYTKITRQINITFAYTFHTTLPTDITIAYSLTQTLTTSSWSYQIDATTLIMTTNQTQINIPIPSVNKSELQILKGRIEADTGTSSTTYALQITPTFTINANTTAGPIHQIFTPTLTIEFKRTDQGDIITIEDLHQTESGTITENQTITRHDILSQRYASYIFITVSVPGLLFSIYLYKKTKPTTEKSSVEKLIAPYKDLIIDAQEPPKTSTETIIINVKTLRELAKTAEILARPIIHAEEGREHVFYVIDNNTKYQHKLQT